LEDSTELKGGMQVFGIQAYRYALECIKFLRRRSKHRHVCARITRNTS